MHNLTRSEEKRNLPTSLLDEEFVCRWTTSLEGIAPEEWNRCFEPEDSLNAFELASAIEHSNLPDTELHYLFGIWSGTLVFVAPCYLFVAPLELLAPAAVRSVVARIRRWFPSFLLIKAFVVGSPLAICKDSLGLARLDARMRQRVLQRVQQEWITQGNRLKAHLVVVKEIEERKLAMVRESLGPRYLTVPSLPTASIVLDQDAPYEARLRRHYRSVYRQRKKRFEQGGITWEILDDGASDSDELFPLYQQVIERADATFGILTPEFFRQVSRRPRGRARVLVARDGNRPLAFVLLLAGPKSLSSLYIGKDYAHRDEFALYYNLLYRSLEEAESLGCERISLGQTAEGSKALIGASFEKLYLALCPLTTTTALILRGFHRALFPTKKAPHHRVFKGEETDPVCRRSGKDASKGSNR